MNDAGNRSMALASVLQLLAYDTLQVARKELNRAWYAWLLTHPHPHLIEAELMLTQGAIRDLHDDATKRREMGDGGEA